MEEEKKPPTTTKTTTTEEKHDGGAKTTEEKHVGGAKEGKSDVDLPVKSPYVEYGNLEDYKMKAYGAKGHEEPKAGQGGGTTDAPTPSGGGGADSTDLSSTKVP